MKNKILVLSLLAIVFVAFTGCGKKETINKNQLNHQPVTSQSNQIEQEPIIKYSAQNNSTAKKKIIEEKDVISLLAKFQGFKNEDIKKLKVDGIDQQTGYYCVTMALDNGEELIKYVDPYTGDLYDGTKKKLNNIIEWKLDTPLGISDDSRAKGMKRKIAFNEVIPLFKKFYGGSNDQNLSLDGVDEATGFYSISWCNPSGGTGGSWYVNPYTGDLYDNFSNRKLGNLLEKNNSKIDQNQQSKEVKMDKELWKKLNIFFSNFSETAVPPFEKDKLSNDELILFGIRHTGQNNYNLIQQGGLNKKYVEASIEKYFDKKSIPNKTVLGCVFDHKSYYCTYKDGFYSIQAPPAQANPVIFPNGEYNMFSQVSKLIDNGNGYYTAYVLLYTYYPDMFEGDPYSSTFDEWKKKNDAQFIPKFDSKMKATIKKETNERYILVNYLKD